MESKIEIVSMELIRPLSPTPNHLKCFEFSYLDQMSMPTVVPLALFYPPLLDHDESSKLRVLKESLSELLTKFYPFAGRIRGNSIECNDDGVPFYEAFARNYNFEDVHRNHHLDIPKHFLPSNELDGSSSSSIFNNSSKLYPLRVQVTIFDCGGMIIGISSSHKIFDASTLCTFTNAWGTLARGDCTNVPEFIPVAKFLPPFISHVPFEPSPHMMLEITKFLFNDKRVTKFISFNASTISSLKALAFSDDVPTPTRVEVVSAAIWKCAMMMSSGTERNMPTRLTHTVNIRRRFIPPLPDHCVGNASTVSTASINETDDTDIRALVSCIRKSLSELSFKFEDKQSRDKAILSLHSDYIELPEAILQRKKTLNVTSICGYDFHVDFGWGKPLWLSLHQIAITNAVILMDTRDRDGGIDAWICLKDNDIMSVFEQELEHLLEFGSTK